MIFVKPPRLRDLRKAQQQRRQERHQTKGSTSKTTAVHVHLRHFSLYMLKIKREAAKKIYMLAYRLFVLSYKKQKMQRHVESNKINF